MKRSIGTGRLAAASTVAAMVTAMVTALAACAPPVSPTRAAPQGSPAGGNAAPAPDTTPASPARDAVPARGAAPGVRAAGLPVTDTGSATDTAAPGRCRTEALAARVGRVEAGAGQRYAPLVFTNTSARTCWVYGFVGLIMIDGSGDALRTRTRRDSVQPRRITLRPRASAHARLHWNEVPAGSRPCPASARLMIIPPDEVAHLEIPFRAAVCGDGRLDVAPMAAGTHL